MNGRVFVGAIAAVFILTGVASAKQGPWILPAKTIHEKNTIDSNASPEVAVGPGRTATAAWLAVDRGDPADETDDRHLVRVATRKPSRSFGAPATLASLPMSAGSFDRLREVHVVAGPGGTLVTWVKVSEEDSVVQARFRPKGGHFGPIRDISHDPVYYLTASAAGANGGFAVSWSNSDGVVQVTVRRPHRGFSTPVDVSGPGPASPAFSDIAVDSNGNVVVVWRRDDFGAGPTTLHVARLPRGDWHGNQQVIARGSTDEAGEIEDPRIAVTPDRTVVVVWSQVEAGGSRIYSRVRRAGSIFSRRVPVSGSGDSRGLANDSPELAVDGDGLVSIVFRKKFEYPGEYGKEPYRTAYVATGKPGGKFRLRRLGGGLGHSAIDPQVTASRNGTSTVLWSEGAGSGPLAVHSATRLPGGKYSAKPRSRPLADGYISEVSVASSGDGNAVAVWRKSDGDSRYIKTASTRAWKRGGL